MNKAEFIRELSAKLKYIPAEDREDAISYYKEYIDEMNLKEGEDVTATIGQPKDVAKAILSEVKEKHINEQKEKKSAKGGATVIWLVVLGLLSAPVSIPLGIVAIVVIFAVAISVISVFLSIVVTVIAMVFAGILALLAIFTAVTFPQGLMCLGIGLTLIGFGVLIGLGLVKLVEAICGIKKKNNKNDLD